MDKAISNLVEKGISEENAIKIVSFYTKVAQNILEKRDTLGNSPTLVALNGAQGSGKSTALTILPLIFESIRPKTKVAGFSIDDVYKTKAQRNELSQKVHPLFITRGVPGTHDLNLAQTTIDSLSKAQKTRIPRFEKALDDRAGTETWPFFDGPADIIIMDGWCMSCPPQPVGELHTPANSLEAKEDPEGIWRKYVNERLAGEYAAFFQQFHYLIMLKAPNFEIVRDWRQKQEIENAQSSLIATAIMNETQIVRFISHYERLTRFMLRVLPHLADCVISINTNHEFQAVEFHNTLKEKT